MQNLSQDTFKEICSHLDAQSITYFISSCKIVREIKTSIEYRVIDYKKVIKKKRWNEGMRISSMKGDIQQINFFIEKGADRWLFGLHGAARGGHKDLVQFFLKKCMYLYSTTSMAEIIDGIIYASEGGCNDIIELIMDDIKLFYRDLIKKEIYWCRVMLGAAKGGHKDLIDLSIHNGANKWNEGMRRAALGGHKDLVEFFISKGADDWNRGMGDAAKGGHKSLVDFFIYQGAWNWDWGMGGAAEGEHKDLIDFFIEKGANNWNFGMHCAARGGHKNIIKFFIEKGATDFNLAITSARAKDHNDIVNFLWNIHSCDVAIEHAIEHYPKFALEFIMTVLIFYSFSVVIFGVVSNYFLKY